jgi:hypothetical protein
MASGSVNPASHHAPSAVATTHAALPTSVLPSPPRARRHAVPATAAEASPTAPAQVAAMTAAALGVLTPQPCLPVLPAPWVPGSPTVMIAGMPALTNSCQLLCAWGGMIAISNPGQTTVMTA